MIIQPNTYLNALDREFGALRNLYSDYFSGYSLDDDKGEYIGSVRQTYLKQVMDEGSPIHNLYGLVVDWFEGSCLRDETKRNHAIGNPSYFERLEKLFHYQHAFLKNEFATEIKEYLDNEDEGRQYVEDLENNHQLDDEDYLKAVRFQLTQITLWLEDQYHQAYSAYQPMLIHPNNQIVPVSNHIRLNYGIKKEETIKLIYEKLNGPYFDVDYPEFVKHFKPQTSFEKIRWTGSLSSLVFLFYGKYQDGEVLTRLKVANNPLKLISDHFAKPDGSSFNQDSIAALPQKIETVKKIRDSDAVIALLKRVA